MIPIFYPPCVQNLFTNILSGFDLKDQEKDRVLFSLYGPFAPCMAATLIQYVGDTVL